MPRTVIIRECSYVNSKGEKCGKNEALPSSFFCNYHLNRVYNLTVKKSSIPNAGNGLFAGKRRFKKGEIIGEYSRYDIQTKYKCDKYKSDKLAHECSSYIYCNKNVCWDAKYYPSIITRYSNDSRSKKNNAFFEDYRGRAFMIASKTIPAGKEIFTDYGDDYVWSFLL